MSQRVPSQLSIDLVAAMAANPDLPKKLREFHAANLADLKRRAAIAAKPETANPFSRFVDSLERDHENNSPDL